MEYKLSLDEVVQKYDSLNYYSKSDKFVKFFGSRYEMNRKLLTIILANTLFSFSVNAFYTTHTLLSGGVGGISVMLQYLTSIPAGISVFVLNIPLFLFGLKDLNKKFLTYAFISTIFQSLMMIVFKNISEIVKVSDTILSCIIGGILSGISMGFLFKNGCCQAGFDIIAAVLKKRYDLKIGSALLLLNATVISIGGILFGLDRALYTIIAMFVSYQVVDKIQLNEGDLKSVMIISPKTEEIANKINMQMMRGVTFIKGEGSWSKADTKIIYMVSKTSELSKLKQIAQSVDRDAFIGISDIYEVRGRGFRSGDID